MVAVAAVHPLVSQAVDTLQQSGVPVFAPISHLFATGAVSDVGRDNWKAGRTAAWTIASVCKSPGKVAILVGSHRFRCREMNESGFRSYFREFAPQFTILEALSTFETSAVAEEMTERLLIEHPDLKGLFVAGGGITGAIRALRPSGKSGRIVAVGQQLMDNTRDGLLDGTLTMILNDRVDMMVREAIAGMMRACQDPPNHGKQTVVLPLDICIRENI